MEVKEMERLAISTLKTLISGRNTTKEIVQYIVQIFYKTETSVFDKIDIRERVLVYPRRLYMFIIYLHFNVGIQEVADEFGFTRSLVYHHCRNVFDEYDSDRDFKDKISILFDEETMEKMRNKLLRKKRKETI